MLDTRTMADATRQLPAVGPRRESRTEQWTLATLAAIFRRRIATIVTIVLAVLALTVLYLAMVPERFTATAVLIPDTRRTPPSPTEVSQESVIDPGIVESQIETLKSEKIALAVIDKLGLADDPEFVGQGPGLMARVRAALGLGSGDSGRDVEELKRRAAVANFTRMLKVQRVGRSYLTEISFTSIDPDKAARTANEAADAYIQDQLGAKLFNAERAGRWMQQRIAELRQQANDARRALEAFKTEHGLDANGRTASEREQEELSAALDRAKAGAGQARARLERVQSVLSSEDGRANLPDSGFLDSLSSQTIARLRADYREIMGQLPGRSTDAREGPPAASDQGARLAQLRNAIWEEIHKIAAARKDDYERAILRETTLTRRVSEYAPQAETNRQLRNQLRELEQQHQTYSQLHEALQTRFARVSQFVQQQSMPVTEARIVTEATPPLRKSSPKTALVLLLALCGGGTLGMGAALGREYFDRTVRRPEQIEHEVGVRWLGKLPRVSARSRLQLASSKNGRPAPGARSRLAGQAERLLSGRSGEMLRAVKLALDDGVAGRHGRVVGIISARAGAGKSTLACAAAMLTGRAGKRTLLIDADLRDPRLTRELMPGLTGALASVIMERSSLGESIVRTGLGFDFIGQAPAFSDMHPSDLLGSPAMSDLTEHLRKGYDYIIVDTPALLEHIDVAASATQFDAFVFVAEWGRTKIEEIDDALAVSQAIGDRVVGVLLNKTKPKHAA